MEYQLTEGVTLADILMARNSIHGISDQTPLVPSPFMGSIWGDTFYLKLENMQPIGAFKLRGAVHAINRLVREETNGVICCSTGNHGRGVAYAARNAEMRAVICMSSLVPKIKIDAIRALGAEVVMAGDSQDDALAESLRLCEQEGLTEISPFDDPHVIAGQGTIGLEILEAQPDIATLLVPLSGGGLAGGIATAAKAINPAIRVIGISMDRGAAMFESVKEGRPVAVEEVASLADSLGGGIGLKNRLSFDLCRRLLDDIVLVTEAEIYHAMQTLYYEDRIIAEGACVVGLAAVMAGKIKGDGRKAATVITGRNVDMQMFTRIANGQDILLGDLRLKGKAYRPHGM